MTKNIFFAGNQGCYFSNKRVIDFFKIIKHGLADSKVGRTKEVKEIRAKYGLTE